MLKPSPKSVFLALGSIIVLIGLGLAYGWLLEPNRLVVRHRSLTAAEWGPAFDGFKIAMIGDIHGGSNNVTIERLREVVATTNAQKPDIVVLLGDYVSEIDESRPERRQLKMPVDTIFDNLRGLEAPGGVYAVLGNHDKPFKPEMASAIARQGYRVLQNEVATLERNGQVLKILGLRDHLDLSSRWGDLAAELKAVLAGTQPGNLIVLQHSPDVLPVITGERSISPDLKLFLAAHTHGGQVWFPLLGRPIIPSSYGQKYAYGHVREGNVDLFVTSGIGTSVLPVRFMVPPEIVILTLNRG